MRIKPFYKLRQIAGQTIIVKQGASSTDLTYIIYLNDTAKLLYEELCGKEFTLEDAASILTDNYDISHELAFKDATQWAEELKNCEVLE